MKKFPKGVRLLHFDDGKEKKTIPVFNLRWQSHHDLIARYYADYKIGVIFGIGVYGATSLVEFPKIGKYPQSARAFWKVKQDRSATDKIPLHIHPKDLPLVIDKNIIHEEFLPYIKTAKAREFFYQQGVAIHLIVPVKKNSNLHPIFITKPRDWQAKRVPKDQWINVPTVSAFWWHDPDLEKIYLKARQANPVAFAGISSFNDHGEEPAWDEQGVLDYLNKKKRYPFDFMVTDPGSEKIGVKSSHPQIAIPLKGEAPVWKVYRTGATDIVAFLRRLKSRHGYRLVEGVRQAARAHDPKVNLDSLVLDVQRHIQNIVKRRQRKLTGRKIYAKLGEIIG